jgi:hypothetical protein
MGAADRIHVQGASLFGLEKYGEPPTEQRIHGYSLGRATLAAEGNEITIWPRKASRSPQGHWRVVADQDLISRRMSPFDRTSFRVGPHDAVAPSMPGQGRRYEVLST